MPRYRRLGVSKNTDRDTCLFQGVSDPNPMGGMGVDLSSSRNEQQIHTDDNWAPSLRRVHSSRERLEHPHHKPYIGMAKTEDSVVDKHVEQEEQQPRRSSSSPPPVSFLRRARSSREAQQQQHDFWSRCSAAAAANNGAAAAAAATVVPASAHQLDQLGPLEAAVQRAMSSRSRTPEKHNDPCSHGQQQKQSNGFFSSRNHEEQQQQKQSNGFFSSRNLEEQQQQQKQSNGFFSSRNHEEQQQQQQQQGNGYAKSSKQSNGLAHQSASLPKLPKQIKQPMYLPRTQSMRYNRIISSDNDEDHDHAPPRHSSFTGLENGSLHKGFAAAAAAAANVDYDLECKKMVVVSASYQTKDGEILSIECAQCGRWLGTVAQRVTLNEGSLKLCQICHPIDEFKADHHLAGSMHKAAVAGAGAGGGGHVKKGSSFIRGLRRMLGLKKKS